MVLEALINVLKEIICGIFGNLGNGLSTGFQKLKVALKCAWFDSISNT